MASSPLPLRATELLKLYEKKKLSPIEAVESCLKQILKYNPVLNAFSYLDGQAALHQAKTPQCHQYKDPAIPHCQSATGI